jgi:hypothetical protein
VVINLDVAVIGLEIILPFRLIQRA